MITVSALKPGWSYDSATRVLTVGQIDCTACLWNRDEIGKGRFQTFPWKACGKCSGTGRRGRGNCRECASFRDGHRPHMIGQYRPGMVADFDKPTDGGPCPKCQGGLLIDAYEGNYGNAPLPADIAEAVIADTPVRVTALAEGMTWGEQHMGYGQLTNDELAMSCMMSMVDYGRLWGQIAQLPEGERWPRVEQVRDEYRQKITASLRRACEVGQSMRADYTQRDSRFRVLDEVVIILRPEGLTIYRVWRKPALV